MPISYMVGDATLPNHDAISEKTLICHIVNDSGLWGAGFVLALDRVYPRVKPAYRRWVKPAYIGPSSFMLGAVQYVPVVADKLCVANMVAQMGIRGADNPKPLSVYHLSRCLWKVSNYCREHSVTAISMPRIGCGLAGGDWTEDVEPLINEILSDFNVTVYDLPK